MQHTKIPALVLALLLFISMLSISINASTQSIPDVTEETSYTPFFRLSVSPEISQSNAGSTVKFNINVQRNIEEELEEQDKYIFLRIDSLPEKWVSKISPSYGKIDFTSKLTIKTSSTSPPGTYNITVRGVSFAGASTHTKLSIILQPKTSENGSTTTYISSIDLSIRTYRNIYAIGDYVEVIGSLSTTFGISISNAKIYLLVMNPEGKLIHINTTQTDRLGTFYNIIPLKSETTIFLNGTYLIYATALLNGKISRTHTTFIVEFPSYPSIQIDSIYILNSAGNESKSIFKLAESMQINTTITNYGISLNSSIVWMEVQAPNRVPIRVMLTAVPLKTGESKEIVFNYKIPSTTRLGIYTIKILISDKPISERGRFLTTGSDTFILEM